MKIKRPHRVIYSAVGITWLIVILTLALTAGCVSTPMPLEESDRVLEVPVRLTPEEVAPRVADLFLGQGLDIQEASPMRVVTAPHLLNPEATFGIQVTMRALLVPIEGGTMVKLSGTWRSPDAQALGNALGGLAQEAPARPISALCTRACREAWLLLGAVADGLGGEDG